MPDAAPAPNPTNIDRVEGLLSEAAAALKEHGRALERSSETLAKASRELPASIARETDAVARAYGGGVCHGCFAGLVAGLILALLLWRKS